MEGAVGRRAGRAGVPVEEILSEPAEGFKTEFRGYRADCERSTVGEVREGEVGPRGDEPVAIAIVEEFGGLAVGVSEIGVQIGRAAEGFEGGRVMGMLPVNADGREGKGVVAKGGSGGGLFTPEAVGVLLANETGKDTTTESAPGGSVENFAAEEDRGSPEGVVIGRSAQEETGEPGSGFAPGGIGGEGFDLPAEAFLPAGAAGRVEPRGEEAVGFKPHVGIAMPIESVGERAGVVLAGE